MIMLTPLPPESICPMNAMMEIISAKWTVEILRELALQPTRTRKFLQHIPGLSMKTLCRRLQILESAGLISRHEFEGKPLKVEYRLTGHGQQLCLILEQLKSLEAELAKKRLSCVCSLEKSCMEDPRIFECPQRRSKSVRAGG
jgi:DNA-binding HxlR family transcriptional regulator